jgi:catechol 2,3-dioxygenase
MMHSMSDRLASPTPLSPGTHPGRATLRVADLDRSLTLYRDLLGLRVVGQVGRTVTLEPGGSPDDDGSAAPVALLTLREVPGLARRPHRPRTTGLYHVALLVPSRRALGRAIAALSAAGYPLSGASDHAVSESLYLDDPDGNGLEIYADRPRAEWRETSGGVFMTTEPMDVAAVLAAGRERVDPWDGLARETVVGHVHFTVSDLERSTAFYRDVVGLDVRMRMSSLVAVAAGGYHHHLNLNSWAGDGAPADLAAVAGLDAWELRVDDDVARAALVNRLKTAGALLDDGPDGVVAARDPDGILMQLPAA